MFELIGKFGWWLAAFGSSRAEVEKAIDKERDEWCDKIRNLTEKHATIFDELELEKQKRQKTEEELLALRGEYVQALKDMTDKFAAMSTGRKIFDKSIPIAPPASTEPPQGPMPPTRMRARDALLMAIDEEARNKYKRSRPAAGEPA